MDFAAISHEIPSVACCICHYIRLFCCETSSYRRFVPGSAAESPPMVRSPPQQALYSYTAEHKNTAILLSGHSSDMLWVSAKRRKSLWNFVYSGIFWRWHGKSALIGPLYLLGANGRAHGKISGLSDNAAGRTAGSVFPCPIPGGPLALRPAIHKKQLEVIGLTVYNDADRMRRKEHQHEQNITS